jgi:hypothetical protein
VPNRVTRNPGRRPRHRPCCSGRGKTRLSSGYCSSSRLSGGNRGFQRTARAGRKWRTRRKWQGSVRSISGGCRAARQTLHWRMDKWKRTLPTARTRSDEASTVAMLVGGNSAQSPAKRSEEARCSHSFLSLCELGNLLT